MGIPSPAVLVLSGRGYAAFRECVEEEFSEVRRSKRIRLSPRGRLPTGRTTPTESRIRLRCIICYINTYQAVATCYASGVREFLARVTDLTRTRCLKATWRSVTSAMGCRSAYAHRNRPCARSRRGGRQGSG